jgi:flagellar biosynthesis/type III secretory pathway M-ring protein FliF/YscJ
MERRLIEMSNLSSNLVVFAEKIPIPIDKDFVNNVLTQAIFKCVIIMILVLLVLMVLWVVVQKLGKKISNWIKGKFDKEKTSKENSNPKDTPACPICSSDMIQRHNRKSGQNFWGCSNYPDCKGTRAEIPK